MKINKLVIAISGASGVSLGLKFIEKLLKYAINTEVFIVVSNGAKVVLQKEMNIELNTESLKSILKIKGNNLDSMESRIIFCDNNRLDSSISSGSFGVDSMAIIPCSMNTLAKISCGISDTLILRCAAVCLKESKLLLLAPREMPFSSIALNNMLALSKLGVIISPPILGYYSNVSSLEEMENFLFGKWLDSLKIDNDLYKRWRGL
ncbi:UbiX family flavin prenyltransferase [Helicobacter sp. MIT 14-3879]|uniref:UbiX family flavin prenyltransferase n=1 Tax=Helicobacter sp. MIT 14-3879 TaxID=2040649 RepID=UPI000E1F1506|nr:UbiX family flavin prenyltransferase [Helicobacter sp. MIT 14-3879]RDU62876.1 3-octaprenyl-4-hydroxybenzoate carboxy-lyase [Helicobacter sp. MIT 14-3879]